MRGNSYEVWGMSLNFSKIVNKFQDDTFKVVQ